MNFKDIKVSECGTFFLYKGQRIFNKFFKEVLKFHSEGLAPVCDDTGWYHIDVNGTPLYKERYDRVFGYYYSKAAVIFDGLWFHVDIKGEKCYNEVYAWVGNYQENVCTVRNLDDQYFHIDANGEKLYLDTYRYAGDFKDGFAVVKLKNGKCKHINKSGDDLNGKLFFNLGVFHKSFATAKDKKGWFHIDKKGNPLYDERYLMVESFYNGFSLVETFDNEQLVIDESGEVVVNI
ncbi:MAG: WG repeat-containing protein [Bacteroidota bacterium]